MMTKNQKTDHVLAIVKAAQQNGFQREEFVTMFNFVWDGLQGARNAAIDPSAPPVEVQQ